MAIPLSNPTLGSLISGVRFMINQKNASNSNWSDADITYCLNEGIRIYFAEVVQNMEGQWTRVADLDIVNGVETVSLPSDCFEVKAVYKASSNEFVVLPYINMISDSYSTNGNAAGSDSYFPSYYFRENNLVLRPVPNYDQTAGLRVEYVYFPESLVNAGDTMSPNVVPLFRQVVEMYAVYKIKTQESLTNGTDTAVLAKQNLNELFKQMVDTIRNRSKYPQFIKPFNP